MDPSSPDLNPLDFCLWSILEANACAKSHTSLDAQKESLIYAWDNIQQDIIRLAVDSVPKRIGRVISAEDGYIKWASDMLVIYMYFIYVSNFAWIDLLEKNLWAKYELCQNLFVTL
jgi:hypothetical protein